jgi:hypothetical protein
LLVANVPKKRRRAAGFPIFRDSPFDEDGTLRHDDSGEAWGKLTTGLPDILKEQVRRLQPFNPPPPETLAFCEANGIDPYTIQGLGLLRDCSDNLSSW